ncbi:hypothetical protein IWW40_001050 [Coemansia sp. RSA 1250]|nr:hypothetical protein IWW40_001050 [Coemansia sp. RSA 1250]
MSCKLLKALFVAVVCIGATAVAQAEDSFTSSEPAPVVRNACHEAPCCEHNAHTTVALPPPLTIAYQDPCHPCCANCVTYSDFHVDNEGDDCCKPAAVIKTHHFVKEVNYKCCTGPCGDVSCEPCCTKIVCNPCGNKGSIAVWPGGSRYCHECCEPCCCHHHECCRPEPCCHHDCCHHDCCHPEPCCHHDCCHHEPCCPEPCCHHGQQFYRYDDDCCCGHHHDDCCCDHHHDDCCCDHHHGDYGYHHECCHHDGCCHHEECCHHECCHHDCNCEKMIVTHALADNCGTHYCVTSCLKDPCGNKCVETHHCFAPNTDPCPCPCKENLSTECCITHCIIEPSCCCGCGCHPPLCTPSFEGSPEPQLAPAPSPAPACPTLAEQAPACPACPACTKRA